MDFAKTLVRSCARAFYSIPNLDVRHILVIDALAVHSTLRDDDLAYILHTNVKDLHKICARLRDDRFIAVHIRQEIKEGQDLVGLKRPTNRTWYYIDYRQTIDAIKWRVYKLGKDMEVPPIPANERKEYFCPRCKAQYTQMEVLDCVGPMGFVCQRCGAVLSQDREHTSAGHERITRMNTQLKFITDLLRRIDAVVVPDNTFDAAFSIRLQVHRDSQHQVAKTIAVESVKPTSVKGLADTGPKKIDVNISTSEGPTEQEKEAERLRKEKIARQNALPQWMSNSTVTGESFSANPNPSGLVPKIEADHEDLARKESLDAKQLADLNRLYANIKKETAASAIKEEEEVSGEDDEDEDDFEDVVASATASAGGSFAISAPIPNAPSVPSPLRQSSNPLKRETDTNGDHVGTADGAGDGRPAKKIKTEDADEDDEDMVFEDV